MRISFPGVAASLSVALFMTIPAAAFTFQWPASTSACEVVNLRWTGGTPPFTAWIIPIYAQPFMYTIPNSTFSNGGGSYNIQLQLSLEQNYVVFMGDATGFGTGGSSEIQATAYDPSLNVTCLQSAAQNQSSLDFTFAIAGVAQTCQRGFDLSWSGGTEDGPYSASIIPCDQSFNPFTVTFDNNLRYESDWPLNLTAGTRFTVMMNSKNGYGRGGVAGIYQVSSSNDTSCLTQASFTTGSWPSAVGTNSLDSATLPVTTALTGPFSANPNGGGSKLTGGEIAGIVIGVIAALALAGLVVALLWRRRRRRQGAEGSGGKAEGGKGEVDLVGPGPPSPVVEPFPPPVHAGSSGPAESVGSTAPGMAGIGAGAAAGAGVMGAGGVASGPRGSGNGAVDEAVEDGEGSATDLSNHHGHQAGPLPRKERTYSNGTYPDASAVPPHTLRVINGDARDGTHTDPDASTSSSGTRQSFASNYDGAGRGSGGGVVPRRRRDVGDGGAGVVAGGGGGGSGSVPTFRRHEDAGRVEEFVDLPPLYTDVPRDQPPPTLPELSFEPTAGSEEEWVGHGGS